MTTNLRRLELTHMALLLPTCDHNLVVAAIHVIALL